ncbi:hypothetical protein F7734_09875 [Scytonema sp. UIC 10036]|uniref:methyltransferase domain-containing protein n=1 Tax=Scytonema sp. UIC 10036 TaxID=2304196 RepID=UPI0012DA04A0|nr:methyltransferase domain-containing protein [Scytonema sp. UIC 10036]MUG92739.1 hypothetical protein [Scytonema sp. UIC 10036]
MNNKAHLAAMPRKRLSSTARLILKLGLLSTEESYLDYGCGRGFDFQKLAEMGYDTAGYDPYYFPDTGVLKPVDFVQFSYVLNTIYNPRERKTTLLKAWSLANKRMVVAAVLRGSPTERWTPIGTFSKEWRNVELRGFIESNLGFATTRIDKDKFLVERDGQQFKPLHHKEVLKRVEAIANEGWVAPFSTVIKKYYSNLSYRPTYGTKEFEEWNQEKAHYRLMCSQPWLPGKNGPVKVLHLRGGLNSEHGQWAIEGLKRRNKIASLKFRCIEQSFLHEFSGCKDFSFLDAEKVKIYE